MQNSHIIDIDGFVPEDEIDKRYIDHPYYIVPDGKAGIDAFAVIRDAMKNKDRVAMARIVLTNREHVRAVEPLGKVSARRTSGIYYKCGEKNKIFQQYKESKDIKRHVRPREPYPRHQGRAF